jgi:hypothetical protein
MPFPKPGYPVTLLRRERQCFPQFPSTRASIIVHAMNYRLRQKSLARQVRRVAQEELEGTLKELLTVTDQARSTAVHEARKHLKGSRIDPVAAPGDRGHFTKMKRRDAQSGRANVVDPRLACPGADDRKADRQVWQAPGTGGVARIQAAMAARLRQVIEESEKEDWSKQAAAEIETRALSPRQVAPEAPYDEIDSKRIKSRVQEGAARPCGCPAQRDRCKSATNCERVVFPTPVSPPMRYRRCSRKAPCRISSSPSTPVEQREFISPVEFYALRRSPYS